MGFWVRGPQIVEGQGQVAPVGSGVLSGDIALDCHGLLQGALRFAESMGFAVDLPQIGEGSGQVGSVGGWILGGELALDGHDLLVGALRFTEALRTLVEY